MKRGQDWAATQNNLGTALRDQAARTAGPKGAELLAQAVSAFHNHRLSRAAGTGNELSSYFPTNHTAADIPGGEPTQFGLFTDSKSANGQSKGRPQKG